MTNVATKSVFAFLLMLILYSCVDKSGRFVLYDDSKEIEYGRVIEWSKDSVLLRSVIEEIDAHNYRMWLSLSMILTCGDTINYHLHDAGNGKRYCIYKDVLYVLNYELDSHESVCGWVSKNDSDNFDLYLKVLEENIPPDSDTAVYNITGESISYNKIINKEIQHGETYIYKSTSELLGLDTGYVSSLGSGLYQYLDKKLNKVSDYPDDIYKIGKGIFYIPPPGTGIKSTFSLVELTAELKKIKKKEQAPQVLVNKHFL